MLLCCFVCGVVVFLFLGVVVCVCRWVFFSLYEVFVYTDVVSNFAGLWWLLDKNSCVALILSSGTGCVMPDGFCGRVNRFKRDEEAFLRLVYCCCI